MGECVKAHYNGQLWPAMQLWWPPTTNTTSKARCAMISAKSKRQWSCTLVQLSKPGWFSWYFLLWLWAGLLKSCAATTIISISSRSHNCWTPPSSTASLSGVQLTLVSHPGATSVNVRSAKGLPGHCWKLPREPQIYSIHPTNQPKAGQVWVTVQATM